MLKHQTDHLVLLTVLEFLWNVIRWEIQWEKKKSCNKRDQWRVFHSCQTERVNLCWNRFPVTHSKTCGEMKILKDSKFLGLFGINSSFQIWHFYKFKQHTFKIKCDKCCHLQEENTKTTHDLDVKWRRTEVSPLFYSSCSKSVIVAKEQTLREQRVSALD